MKHSLPEGEGQLICLRTSGNLGDICGPLGGVSRAELILREDPADLSAVCAGT